MYDIVYLLKHFFTHKDFLPDAALLPGTMFTPLHFVFEGVVLALVIGGAVYVSKHRGLIRPVFTGLFVSLVLFEVGIVAWDSLSGAVKGLDLAVNLPLYPCSIFMFVLPFIIWSDGWKKQAACGYVCTLGLVGALINFLYPIARLREYSCLSLPAFHTFFFHGSMLFAALVLMLTGIHHYGNQSTWWTPFLASLPGLIVSIPANLVNYSPVGADYMYFTNQHFLSKAVFGNLSAPRVTAIMYLVYLVGPALFYLPAFVMGKVWGTEEPILTEREV